MRRGWPVLVAASLTAASCIDLTTDPDEIVAIEFADLPWPSVVAGDTLRDASGAVAPMVARLFDGDGDIVSGPVEFLPQQASVRVVNGDQLVADDTATGKVGIIASIPGIQSAARQIEIVPAPDSITADAVIVPLEWIVPDDVNQNSSQPLGVRVLSNATTTPSPVRSWIVTFTLEAGGRQIPESDTTQVFLIGDNGRPSYVDTTDAAGKASRRVRLRVAPGLVPPDSAIITMRATYRGAPLAGAPVILVLPLSAR